MANTIKVTYKVNEDGSLERISKNAEKAARSTDKATQSKNRYNKVEKGTAQLTSNSTKAFAKQAGVIGSGLVPAYATLAANVFAVTAAFGVLQRAAAVEQLQAGLMTVGRSGGANLKIVAEGLREVTDLAVSTQSAMEATAIATSAGFSESQIISLGEVAKGASLALGRDMSDALTRLTRGTSKLEPELLDELGIFVKLEQATTEYAATLGKGADELTQFERRQAFVNAAIAEGQKKFGILNNFVDANPYDRLAASFADLTKSSLNFLNNFLSPFVGFLADTPIALVGLFAAFASGIVKQIIPTIQDTALAAKEESKQLAITAQKAARVVSDDYKKAAANVSNAWKTVPPSVAKLEQNFKKGTYTAQELKTAIARLSSSEKLRANAAINSNKEIAAQRALELKQVRALKAEMIALQQAEKSRFTASAAGITAQRSSVGAGLTARGLSEMERASGLMEKFGVAIKYTTLQFANLGKTSGFLPSLTVGLKSVAGAARLFGSALLSAIPFLGQLLVFGPMLYEAFKWMFTNTPSLLDKELKKAAERYEEFNNIVDQMAESYARATSRTEAFAIALKPAVGLLKQTREQIEAISNAQKSEAQQRVREAQVRLALARVELNRQEQKGFVAGQSANAPKKAAKREVNDAAENLKTVQQEAEIVILDEKAIRGVIDGVGRLQGHLSTLKETTVEGSTEFKQYGDALNVLETVMNTAIGGKIPQAIDMLKELEIQYGAEVGANEAAVEVMQKYAAATAAAQKTTGPFAATIELLKEANNNLESTKAPETIAAYSRAFDEFGISYDKSIGDLKKEDIISDDQLKSLETAKKELKEIQALYVAFNNTSKFMAESQTIIAEQARQLNLAGQESLALELELSALKMATAHALADLELTRGKETSTVEEIQAKIVTHLQAQTAEMMKQEKIRQQKVEDAQRRYGDGMAAVIDTTSMVERDKDKMKDFSPDSIKTMNQAMQPMIDNLAKLGPEGELMAQLTQSAFVLTEVFTEAFDKMSTGSLTMTDGIMVAASAINALGQIQSAQGKAAVAGIDKQIAAEKKRDGKSQESLAKIAALEKKKEAMERKNFERNKKMQMASVVASTAVGIMKAYEQGGMLGFITGSLIAAIGAMQLATISGTSFDGGGAGGVQGPSKISIGNRQNSVDLAKARSPSGELAYARGAQGTGTGMTNYTPAFTGAKYRAGGGNVGLMVGEQGPEMFIPDRPGTIVPADETQGFTGQPVNVNFSIQAIDSSSVEELLMVQRGNIIGMIREAANSHGELFLENINNQSLPVDRYSRRY